MSATGGGTRVLLIEDNADDAELLVREFRRHEFKVETKVAPSLHVARCLLRDESWDVVLSDYNLPNTHFSDIASAVKAADRDMPIVVVSGAVGEEIAVSLLREGASDLVLKHNLSRLVPAVVRELAAAEQNHARRASEERYRQIVEATSDWIWETDAEHRIAFTAESGEQAEWSDPLRSVGRTLWEACGIDIERDPHWRGHKRVLDAREPFRHFRFAFRAPAGGEFHLVMTGAPVFNRGGAFLGYRGVASDETLIVETYLRAERAEARLKAGLLPVFRTPG
ncbi:response regulator [Jiella mangrovi]|uniref:Response regulator n=1 Tax=Jiella mangrovi TaxID=2821407 RepID=A0ABS4BJ54_9HYPH|nr:response regulator [Jiella mangrovi]MBP0616803.1 response regulator [Jiella mangrovi]